MLLATVSQNARRSADASADGTSVRSRSSASTSAHGRWITPAASQTELRGVSEHWLRGPSRRPGDHRQFEDLPKWDFWVHEFSASGWRVTAVREGGTTGEGTGSDPEALLDDYYRWALGVDRDLLAQQSRQGTSSPGPDH